MARISGVDIPNNKRVVISLTYIYGIGKPTAEEILKNANGCKNQTPRRRPERLIFIWGLLFTGCARAGRGWR